MLMQMCLIGCLALDQESRVMLVCGLPTTTEIFPSDHQSEC